MSSNSPGSYLGYALQTPRALFHLLKAGPGDVVCVEVKGDVLTSLHDGMEISEEDKSSIHSNPVTDKSVNLWKTFHNWIVAINDGDLGAETTQFLLYTNQSGNPGIIDEFDSAKSESEAMAAIDHAKNKLTDISKDHSIWPFYNFVVNENRSVLCDIIKNFKLLVGAGAGYDELKRELERQHHIASGIPSLIEELCGWLQKQLTEKIAADQLAIVTWAEFDKKFKVLFQRIRTLELIDFTRQDDISLGDIEQQVAIQPRYLQQLNYIDSSEDELVEAVSDFLRARVNRDKWIENEIIDEEVAAEFEDNLILFWRNQKKRIKLTNVGLSDEVFGRLLLLDCKVRRQTLRGQSPPASTISGTYHALADQPVLGWHPDWEGLLGG